MKTASQILEQKGYDLDEQNDIVCYKLDPKTRDQFGIEEPIHLWDGYTRGDADETALESIAIKKGYKNYRDMLDAMDKHLNNLAEEYPAKKS